MAIPRYDHTATLLSNGKVLVTGGETNLWLPFTTPTSSAELYDPSTGTWTTTGEMTTPRMNHTATLLFNGKVLVAGGRDDTAPTLVGSAELYDPVTGRWTGVGSMNTERYMHTATLLPDGRVLVAGGSGIVGDYVDSLSSAELYDPGTEAWTTTGALNTVRRHHTLTLLPNGKVLIAGGYASSNDINYGAELYDPITGKWTETGALTTAADTGVRTATLLFNGKVLLAKGLEYIGPGLGWRPVSQWYDPVTETWTVTGGMTVRGGYHSAVLLPDGKVQAAGGYAGAVLSSADTFTPAINTWAAIGSMITPRKNHTATLLSNGNVLIAGGYSFDVLIYCELYDAVSAPVTAVTLTSATMLPSGLFHFSFTNTHGALFVVQATTNPTLPPSNWTEIGCAIELTPGQFQFTDLEAANFGQRYYRIRSP